MKRSKGFTIVELLIVIVVIAILAAITIVAYNGIQTRANNTATQLGVANYAKAMAVYARFNDNVYPGAGSNFCAKDDQDNNTCVRVAGSTSCFSLGTAIRNSTADDAIKTVASLPSVSSQTMSCNGLSYRGVYITVPATGKSGTIFVFLRGDINPCPGIGGVNYSSRQQQDDMTLCRYTLPQL